MKLHVLHRTRYDYDTPVRESYNEARLQPVTAGDQVRHAFLLKTMSSTRFSHYRDFYFNCVHQFELSESHSQLIVESTATVTTADEPVLPDAATPAPLADIARVGQQEQCHDFLQSSTFVEVAPELWRLALDATVGQTDTWQAARAIMRFINREFRYQAETTNVHTHMHDVLVQRAGVCQDFAHVMIGMCRAIGLPARYVSGYLYNGPAESLKGAQASHAWVDVFVPGIGWCGLDPTNNRTIDGHFIRVAIGRDYADVPPVRGTYRGTEKRRLSVEVAVTRFE
jgi:transglutaminase-like putative cysteine protease